MSQVYVLSPSGAVRDRAGLRRGLAWLRQQGHSVTSDPAVLKSSQRFAGDDSERLQALSRAAASGADAVLVTRGGYGLSRILPHIDYAAIYASMQQGTALIGQSDFTALQLALWRWAGETNSKLEAVGQKKQPKRLPKGLPNTWQGPLVVADLGHEDPKTGAPDDITTDCLTDVLQGVSDGCGWRLSLRDNPRSYLQQAVQSLPLQQLAAKPAMLWGGNLSMVCSLLGTAHFPTASQTQGGILYLEDVGEHPYKIERMFTQLLHAGLLHSQRAVLLGQFSSYKLTPHDRGFNLNTAVQWLRQQTPTPILTGLPFGHEPLKVCLPFARPARLLLDAESRSAETLLLWD